MGIDGLVDDFREFKVTAVDYIEAVESAVDKALEKRTRIDIKADAVKRAPKEDGDLKRSATLVKDGPAEYRVVFPMEYALIQHENMTFEHDIGGPKYLERAMIAAKFKGFSSNVADETNRRLDV